MQPNWIIFGSWERPMILVNVPKFSSKNNGALSLGILRKKEKILCDSMVCQSPLKTARQQFACYAPVFGCCAVQYWQSTPKHPDKGD